MKTKGTWISFNLMEKKPKTDVWGVSTKDGDWLGQIKWFGRWRTYSFFPWPNTVYEHKCMSEITEFMNELMRLRKEKV